MNIQDKDSDTQIIPENESTREFLKHVEDAKARAYKVSVLLTVSAFVSVAIMYGILFPLIKI